MDLLNHNENMTNLYLREYKKRVSLNLELIIRIDSIKAFIIGYNIMTALLYSPESEIEYIFGTFLSNMMKRSIIIGSSTLSKLPV